MAVYTPAAIELLKGAAMYTLVSATLKTRQKSSVYETVDIGNITMQDLFSTYLDGWVALTNPVLSGTQYIDLNALKSSVLPLHPFLTFNAWLGALGNLFIPALSQQPTLETKLVKYSDAFRARYDIIRAHPTYALNVDVPLAAKTDVVMSKQGVDPALIFNNVMISINGLFHITDNYLGQHLRVKGGGRSCEISNRNNIGILSFREIGEIQSIPLTDGMFTASDIDVPFKQTIWLNTGVDMTGKTPLIVIGGYLHVADNVYSVVNAELGIIQVNLDKIDLPHRIFESKTLIDLSSLELTVDEDNTDLISLPELYSDAVIQRYLKLPQSFVVLVDTPTLYLKKYRLTSAHLPGLYITHAEPTLPLQLRTGITPEYWSRREDDLWTINVTDNLSPNYRFETTQWQAEPAILPILDTDDSVDYSQADLLEIGTQVRT